MPYLKRKPSEYIRDHIFWTTQPMEDPERREHLFDVIDWIGWDKLLFATDYPHWDFDEPSRVLPAGVSDANRRRFISAMRRSVYGHYLDGAARGGARWMNCRRARENFSPSTAGRSRSSTSRASIFGLLNRCPHQGAALCEGPLIGLAQSSDPGEIEYTRLGEILRCPWHGWEFDIRTGQSYCDPKKFRTRAYPVNVEPGTNVVKGPYVAETIEVSVESDYVVVDL